MAQEHPQAEAVSSVTIGIDPHKGSHTAAALDSRQRVLGQIRVLATSAGYRELRRWAAGWPERRWAVENVGGLGRSVAQWLLGDGETVIDVPPKLSARIRVLSTGHGRKTDPADAVSTALAACGPADLQAATLESHATTLRLLSDRRDDLVARRTQVLNRLHALLADLVPGTVPSRLSAATAAALLRRSRPPAGPRRTRRVVGERPRPRSTAPGQRDRGPGGSHRRGGQRSLGPSSPSCSGSARSSPPRSWAESATRGASPRLRDSRRTAGSPRSRRQAATWCAIGSLGPATASSTSRST